MSDLPLLAEILDQILEGIRRIEHRFSAIESPNDFLKDDAGLDRLDGIGMMLIAIGESLKNFERSGGKALMDRHLDVDWKGAKGVRDFLSHHYFDLDAVVLHPDLPIIAHERCWAFTSSYRFVAAHGVTDRGRRIRETSPPIAISTPRR